MPKPRTLKVVLTLKVEKGEDVKAKELAKRANWRAFFNGNATTIAKVEVDEI